MKLHFHASDLENYKIAARLERMELNCYLKLAIHRDAQLVIKRLRADFDRPKKRLLVTRKSVYEVFLTVLKRKLR